MARIQYNGKTIQFGGSSIIKPSPPPIFDDWFLPSLDEVQQMYINLYLEDVGGLSSKGAYWTSSEASISDSRTYSMYGTISDSPKGSTFNIRPCRSFTAGVGEYSLRDEGPSGGLIFYIDGTTYYEAAPSDHPNPEVWSNVTSSLIGTTGNAIGTGQQNTLDIINQAGHTGGAAKICDDLIIEN